MILNARLTRFYEREDWKRRLAETAGEALQLERGVEQVWRPPNAEEENSAPAEDEEQASSIELAARQALTKIEATKKQLRLL